MGGLTGGAGAVIGALANKKSTTVSEQKISGIIIKVKLGNGIEKDLILLKKEKNGKGFDKDSFSVRHALEKAQNFQKRLLKILDEEK